MLVGFSWWQVSSQRRIRDTLGRGDGQSPFDPLPFTSTAKNAAHLLADKCRCNNPLTAALASGGTGNRLAFDAHWTVLLAPALADTFSPGGGATWMVLRGPVHELERKEDLGAA